MGYFSQQQGLVFGAANQQPHLHFSQQSFLVHSPGEAAGCSWAAVITTAVPKTVMPARQRSTAATRISRMLVIRG